MILAQVMGSVVSTRKDPALMSLKLLLVREVESAQRSFDAVMARFNQSTLESQTTQSNVSLLTAAEPPLEPSSPRVLLNLVVGLLLGGALAIGSAVLIELLDRRVRIAQDMSSSAGLAMLGSLAPTGRRRLFGRGEKATPAQRRMVGLSRAPTSASSGNAVPSRLNATEPPVQEVVELSARTTITAPVLDRSIGELIAESCNLKPEQVDQILALQRKTGVRFGEAAIELGLANTADVLHALAQQYHYPYAAQAEHKQSPELVTLNDPVSAPSESFRAIRSQVMKRVFNDRTHPRRALAVVSPNAGDGKTYFAANLAISLAQLGGRTLLIDADLRGPRQHRVYNLANTVGLEGILSGRADRHGVQQVPGVPGLFLLPVANPPPNPLELVERPSFGLLIRELAAQFDHVVVDTPAAQFGADAAVIAEHCGASLMLVRQHVTQIAAFDDMVVQLQDDTSLQLVGVVLNRHGQ